jgi:ABC-type glycerol-3-phosphate transport system permease component
MATQVMVAYAVAKYDFKLKNWYYRVAIIVMLIPIVGSLASELAFAEFFKFNNNVFGVSFMRAKYPGVYFLVFYATFRSVSSTYMEAAELDGAGHLQIFFQIMLPLIKSSLFAVFILLFIQNWNDYYTPMIFLKSKPVMTYALFLLQSDGQLELNRKFAACVASAIPIVLLFIIFRNKIMGNVTMGGIKG